MNKLEANKFRDVLASIPLRNEYRGGNWSDRHVSWAASCEPTCKSEMVVKLPTVASCTSVGHKRFTSIARLYGTAMAFCRPSCRARSLTDFSSGVCLGSFRASCNGFHKIIIKRSVFSLLIWGFLGIFNAQMGARCEHGMNLWRCERGHDLLIRQQLSRSEEKHYLLTYSMEQNPSWEANQ
jgi:hypothetical protein